MWWLLAAAVLGTAAADLSLSVVGGGPGIHGVPSPAALRFAGWRDYALTIDAPVAVVGQSTLCQLVETEHAAADLRGKIVLVSNESELCIETAHQWLAAAGAEAIITYAGLVDRPTGWMAVWHTEDRDIIEAVATTAVPMVEIGLNDAMRLRELVESAGGQPLHLELADTPNPWLELFGSAVKRGIRGACL